MNNQNRFRAGSTSKYRGVYWNKETGKWHARGKANFGKRVSIGYFDDEHEAGLAAHEWRIENMQYYNPDEFYKIVGE